MSELDSGSNQLKIQIRFFSSLRNTVGLDQIEISIIKGESLLSILQKVEKDYFTPKNAHFLESDTNGFVIGIGIILLIDDVDISLSGGLNQKITKPITITLISSIHGG